MKNKVELKKAIIFCLIVIIFGLVFLGINYYQYKVYTFNFNQKIDRIISKLYEDYPKIDKVELIEILNSKKDNSDNFYLKKYGIDLNKDSLILENDRYFKMFSILNIGIVAFFSIILLSIFLRYNYLKDKKIREITGYIEEINKRNYKLNIDDYVEDELSILKSEIYKTTVNLKEMAENSLKDKINLKDSLQDISHQLKTPITSIIIMLDNILDDKDMNPIIKEEFIKDIKREITNISFLVSSLLKLSKFDSNTVKFINKYEYIDDILKEAVKNVSVLCDLKNIEIEIDGNKEIKINCDFRWQVEAITNILKNCVEHSKENSKINIIYEKNNIYSKIEIKDNGIGIDSQDLPHIFERFYKGKNSSTDSVGIGLALAKTIIENNNGQVDVISYVNYGTTFVIKYF